MLRERGEEVCRVATVEDQVEIAGFLTLGGSHMQGSQGADQAVAAGVHQREAR